MDSDSTQRLDKWLWAARFFKTRKLATEAINGGKVHLNGQRTKPGREIRAGCELIISKDTVCREVTVLGVCAQRRPAPEARCLYQESPESIEKRRLQAETRQQERQLLPQSEGRPTKKQRRQIHRFKRK